MNSQLPNGDASVVEQADSFVSRLLDPRWNRGKSVEVKKPGGVPSAPSGCVGEELTAKVSFETAVAQLRAEGHIVDSKSVEGVATYRDLMESIAISVLVICYEFALLYYFLPTIPVWQIGLAVAAKAVAFRGQAFPKFLNKWKEGLQPYFVVAYLPMIAVALVGALIFKGAAWLLSPVFRIAKSAT
ncbi:hypothetical protein D9M68_616420 [compost metagenome]